MVFGQILNDLMLNQTTFTVLEWKQNKAKQNTTLVDFKYG